MPHHRFGRPATHRLLITGALTLTSAMGVGALQGPQEEAAYRVSSVGELTRLPADTVAVEGHATGGGASADQAGTGVGVQATPAEPAPLQRALPKIRTADRAQAQGEEAAGTQESEVPAEPPPPPPPAPAPDPVWSSLAACESGGNWQIDTGNGYYGGLQFSIESWHGVGGQGYPHQHPRDVQIAMAERLHALQGWNAWPVCSRRLGLI